MKIAKPLKINLISQQEKLPFNYEREALLLLLTNYKLA